MKLQITLKKSPISSLQVHKDTVAALGLHLSLIHISLTRYTKRGGQVWIKIFPDKPVTAKPAETRMGSGKGSPESWVAVVKPGRVLFEIAGVPADVAREALRLASQMCIRDRGQADDGVGVHGRAANERLLAVFPVDCLLYTSGPCACD